MHITGSGTSLDPYVIFGNVKLDPNVDNVLSATANGLLLTCSDIQDCVGGVGVTHVSDTSTVDLTISGAGTTVSPYVITASIILDPAGTNLLLANPGGLFLSCAQVRGCLSAGNGITYNSTTGAISAHLSTDPGNTLVIGTDGGIYDPPGSGVFTDCGLSGTGTLVDPILVDTGGSAWPFGCDDTEGAPVYCGSDGALRVDPEKFVVYDSVELSTPSDQTDTLAPVGTGPTDVTGPAFFDITNPSTCRDMVLFVEAGVNHCRVVYSGAGANEVTIGTTLLVSGDVTDTVNQAGHQRWRFGGGTTITFDTMGSRSRRTYTLGPGQSATFNIYNNLDTIAYNGTASLNNWSGYVSVTGYSI